MDNSFNALQKRMNSENRWTNTVNYFQVLILKRVNKTTTLNEEINDHLKKIQYVEPDESIDWEKEQEISEFTFKDFSLRKLTHSLAYDSEIMPRDRASDYLDEFVSHFGPEKKFYTNYDDLDEIIAEHGTIENYQSKGTYGYGTAEISKNTFDCGLIVVDREKIGAIVIRDED